MKVCVRILQAKVFFFIVWIFTSGLAHAVPIPVLDLDDDVVFGGPDNALVIDPSKWFSADTRLAPTEQNCTADPHQPGCFIDGVPIGSLGTSVYLRNSPDASIYLVTMEVTYFDAWYDVLGNSQLTFGDSFFTGFAAKGVFAAGWSHSQALFASLGSGDVFDVSTDQDDVLSFVINSNGDWNPNSTITFFYLTQCFGGEAKCLKEKNYNLIDGQRQALGYAVVSEPPTIGLIVAALFGLYTSRRKRAT